MAVRSKPARLRLWNPQTGKRYWSTLCSVPMRLYNAYLSAAHITDAELVAKVEEWSAADFGEAIPVNTLKDVAMLRDRIAARSHTMYPVIYENITATPEDWTRVWLVQHMEDTVAREVWSKDE